MSAFPRCTWATSSPSGAAGLTASAQAQSISSATRSRARYSWGAREWSSTLKSIDAPAPRLTAIDATAVLARYTYNADADLIGDPADQLVGLGRQDCEH